MSDHADIVREWIGGCLALHGFREDCPACVAYRDANAALDSLVAERDRLREALSEIAEHRTGHRTLTMHAFAALGEDAS
jgi:hypothetical protein